MSKYSDFYQTIDEITQHLRADFIGPVREDEVLEGEEPLNRYSLGILWAQTRNDSAETITVSDSMETELFEENAEEESALNINIYKPSSMALSFAVPINDTLHISFSYGKYLYTEETVPASETTKAYTRHLYTRRPETFSADVHVPERTGNLPVSGSTPDLPVSILLHVRRMNENQTQLITVSVMNRNRISNISTEQNQEALFQCHLSVRSEKGFVPIYSHHGIKSQEDEINDMLYHSVQNYSYGHGCASVCKATEGRITEIESEFIPQHRALQMMPRLFHNAEYLSMQYWKHVSRETGCAALSELVKQYEIWLHHLEENSAIIEQYPASAKLSFQNIRQCIQRLYHGIQILRHNDIVWKSFCYMNEAMLWQRVRTKHCTPESVSWYPFQMAYILQIIPDIAEETSVFRDSVDLLWFPTGGGKTEAYLGLSAFTIFFRRLSGKSGNQRDGVTIIMRYTLRLLTIQQFERAAALICACEFMRKQYQIPGNEISIGLWIGSGMTPNHIADAEATLKKLREDVTAKLYEANPMQVTKCPWCGSDIDIGGYTVQNQRMHICCHRNPECAFHHRLPVYVVDDDIYEQKPTLLLSTVDKFARITWEERAGALLGADGNCPPSLIIQDELHLISGPLGSVAGLYEIAIDEICRHYGTSPKIIASTATVRNAARQIKILYNRNMIQFPPNGLSYQDSFFAVEAGTDQRPARTYTGICSIGGTSSELLIKIFALLIYLKCLWQKQDKPFEVIDQFFTTVGYFNSLKELGTSSTIITDRIFNEIKYLISYKFREEAESFHLSAENKDIPAYLKNDELTSRNSAKEIKEVLERLTERWNHPDCFDYIMASNMLSVGIDIDRLGVMCVYGQPKSNSEYIQATSRVGRTNPGLVISLYNGVRSRDKSYYEQFNYYHKTFYKYVEATSVTSYSARAVEKALHCAFMAVVRHTVPKYNSNQSARLFKSADPDISAVKQAILKRVDQTDPRMTAYAEEWLDYYLTCWKQLAEKLPSTLVYYDYHNENISLFRSAEHNIGSEIPAILNSVRNVELSSDVYFTQR